MSESIQLLNVAGITPVLLKGSAILAAEPSTEKNAWRLVSDIDLLVNDDELTSAINSLTAIGYAVADVSETGGRSVTLARQSDAGMLDIHTKVRGPAAFRADEELYKSSLSTSVGLANVLLPSPTFQLIHFVLHDQFYGRDFWRGSLDLRHLCDLARIVSQQDIDWSYLQRLFSTRVSADLLSCQLTQANRLLGVPVPQIFLNSFIARLQYWRILIQLRYPIARKPLILLTVLFGWGYRCRDEGDYQVGAGRKIIGRLRGAWRLLSAKPVGKLS
jgi:hypothetical protein